MSIKIKTLVAILAVLSIILSFNTCTKVVYADELKDNIDEQLENIDLNELEEYFNDNVDFATNINFFTYVNKILNGEYDFEFTSFSTYVINLLKENVRSVLPIFIEIFIIALISIGI